MVYFGPADAARAYFEDLGFQPAHRQTTPDFLVSVTDELGRMPKAGWENRIPRNAEDMAQCFAKSELADRNREEVAGFLMEMGHPVPSTLSVDMEGLDLERRSNESDEKHRRKSAYMQSAHAERAKHTRTQSPYTISVPMQVRAVIQRRVQILLGDWTSQALLIG